MIIKLQLKGKDLIWVRVQDISAINLFERTNIETLEPEWAVCLYMKSGEVFDLRAFNADEKAHAFCERLLGDLRTCELKYEG